MHRCLKDMTDWWIFSYLKLLWGLLVMITFLLLLITVTMVKIDLPVALQFPNLVNWPIPQASLTISTPGGSARADQQAPLSAHQLPQMAQMDQLALHLKITFQSI